MSAIYLANCVPTSGASVLMEGKMETMSRAKCRRMRSMLKCILHVPAAGLVVRVLRIAGISFPQKAASACCTACAQDFALDTPSLVSAAAARARFRGRSWCIRCARTPALSHGYTATRSTLAFDEPGTYLKACLRALLLAEQVPWNAQRLYAVQALHVLKVLREAHVAVDGLAHAQR